ncbi:unnamed protein product [Microthlaspi erraticum]|uniref:RBR-type E3 ubiquitin transferase n=1 Tax=Microthlaspi erraticum TaxID=1685480 RepID=A0A6D2IXY0_9BRAS|nr:unnamed protein product [Microthlaspi erraticum]
MDAEAKDSKKESCVICTEDNIDSELMFSVDKCGHRFCLNCVERNIAVNLLDGTIPNCLEHRCKSQLSIDRCGMLLTRKLSLMWRQRIKENSTPLDERIYCPDQSCSYLMSKKELGSSVDDESGLRRCFKCFRSFCLRCKVPWHSSLSCKAYKKLHPNPQDDDDEDDAKLRSLAKRKGWRQCGKCHYMVERIEGCFFMRCRCGNTFCYMCGEGSVQHNPRCRTQDPHWIARWLFRGSFVIGVVLSLLRLIL